MGVGGARFPQPSLATAVPLTHATLPKPTHPTTPSYTPCTQEFFLLNEDGSDVRRSVDASQVLGVVPNALGLGPGMAHFRPFCQVAYPHPHFGILVCQNRDLAVSWAT